MTEPQQTVSIRGLKLGYRHRTLIEHADLTLHRGEFASLIGRNGTGKSTLLRTLAGLTRPLAGSVCVQGVPLERMPPRTAAATIAFVSTERIRTANLRAADVVALGRTPYTGWTGSLSAADRRIVEESLALVGMESFARKTMDSLSDGERQRVMIARALAQQTPVVLLDEPTAFLDVPNKYEISLLLRSLAHTQQRCIVSSTHDLNVAVEMSDTLVLLDSGGIESGPAREMVARGAVQRLFRGTGLTFDPDTCRVFR